MRIIKKCIEAIKEGQLIYKVHRHLFITRKFYRLYNLISKWQKINEKKIVFVSYYGAGYGDNPKAIADYIIENNVLEDAVSDVMSIIRAGQLEISKMKNKISEVITNA